MSIVYSHHEGSQAVKPTAIDTTSSKTAVYLRKNIERIIREDPMTGESVALWSYDEAKLTPAEWEAYKTEAVTEFLSKSEEITTSVERNNANIDYLSMMTGVDLPDSD